MFCTKNADKSRLSVLATTPGETYWQAAELVLNTPWFMVMFTQAVPTGHQEAITCGGTMMFSRIEEVEKMMKSHAKDHIEIESLLVVTPRHVNGTQSWKMEPLRAVWMAEEPSAPGRHMIEIYETDEGVKYSMYGTPSEELNNHILRFRWNG